MTYTPLSRQSNEFQQAPTVEELERLCRRLLPAGADIESATEITGGYFNSAIVLKTEAGRFVLRISPPHDHPMLFSNERYLLRREFSLTPFLATVAPLLPRIVAADFTGEIMGRDAVMSQFIEGENWDSVQKDMTAEDNDVIWRELGGLLRKIHQTRGSRFGWCDPEKGHRSWSEFILGAARGLLADCPRFGVDDTNVRAWLKVVEEGAWVLDQISEPRLVHGDPWPKNILIDRTNGAPRIVGLLDHERGLWGDPMDEWVFHQLSFPAAFWQAYGQRPTGPAAEFRNCVYFGFIEEQVLLEAIRYHYDASSVQKRMVATTERMRALLAQCE